VFIDRGATATCEIDGDISKLITVSGSVNESAAGRYVLTYTVTNSSGMTASVTREVHVVAPRVVSMPNERVRFSGQAKVGDRPANYTVNSAEGMMSLTVSGLGNRVAVRVRVVDSTGLEVFNHRFAANETREFRVAQGTCFIEVTMIEGNGNNKFDLTVLPAAGTEIRWDVEDYFESSPFEGGIVFYIIFCGAGILAGISGTLAVAKIRRRKAEVK
jgi:hypothetical protein